jgi:hypothetical protein
MKLMLSGEGPTDIGVNQPVPGGARFVPGPMAELVDWFCRKSMGGFSPLEWQRDYPETDTVQYLGRGDLSQRKQMREDRPRLLPGHKRPSGLADQEAQAWTLGRLAVEKAHTDQDVVVAILFHDCDGTRSAPPSQWQDRVTAIEHGFALASCSTSVAMVPRPKSEAWLLCALKTSPYQHCDSLEEAPGNDGSPKDLKTRLKAINGGKEPTGDQQAEWVRAGRIDPERIDMPSFKAFTDRLEVVLAQVTRLHR